MFFIESGLGVDSSIGEGEEFELMLLVVYNL